MDRNESLSSQIERDIEDSVQIKQGLKAYGELVSEIQMYKTAAFRLAKTNDELLERLTYVEAERDALAKREYELLKHIRDGKTLRTNKEFDYERYHPYINAGYVNGLCFRYEKEHPEATK